jgi:hypothetical protein
MKDRNRENLADLLEHFFGASEAKVADDEIQAAERMLDTYPAPGPDAQIVTEIKAQIAARLSARRRISRAIHRSIIAAAAVVVVAISALLGPFPASRTDMVHASIIPAAIWESDDIATDDLDLVYFNSEIRRIEAELQTLESGPNEDTDSSTLGELEIELIHIETEFWKG